MKRSIAIALLLTLASYSVRAQAPSGVTLTHHRHDLQSITTRDYWIALPQNYDDEGGKYVMLYISSAESTTAYVAIGGDTTAITVVPGRPSIYNVPLTWEIKTSDAVENKGIHVWSDDAALFVDFNSHNPYTSDATYVIPSIGWGTSYVVASYASLCGGTVFDEPSEFVVIANQDGTDVTITPSIDLRGTSNTTIAHPKGVPFIMHLDAGQTIQYQAVQVDALGIDVSGTVITSSKPIGVIGATQCANIPEDWPYCDFICEMLPPTRTWGTSYYTAPLVGHKGGDTYLVIGSIPGQTIRRTDSTGTSIFATLANPYDHYFRHDVATPGSWTSDAPFLLMQYSNSATWPDNVNGNYDPFMMAINATNHFLTPVIFNVLSNAKDQQPYKWHASIVAVSGLPVFVDGNRLTATPIYDDHQCAIYQIDALQSKQYSVSSEGGISVSVYGQGYDEAVGYAGTIGVSTIGSLDTNAPMAVASAVSPTVTHVDASKPGASISGLSHFEVDKMSNMTIVQPQSFIEGNGDATGSFDLVVADPSKPAHATVRVLDLAGNYTTVEKNYVPGAAAVAPDPKPIATGLNNGSSAPTIEYSVAHDGRVTINLFDLLGNRVLSVLDADESTGAHSVMPDVRLLPSGVYIYRVESSDGVNSGRLMVTR